MKKVKVISFSDLVKDKKYILNIEVYGRYGSEVENEIYIGDYDEVIEFLKKKFNWCVDCEGEEEGNEKLSLDEMFKSFEEFNGDGMDYILIGLLDF